MVDRGGQLIGRLKQCITGSGIKQLGPLIFKVNDLFSQAAIAMQIMISNDNRFVILLLQ